jgi:hypothetical protein
MVRALKNTKPDAEKTKGRPTYKIATAARALEAHRRSTGRTNSRTSGDAIDTGWQDPILVGLYAEFDAADSAMRKLPTIEARRKAARAMGPLINRLDRATRERGIANGQDEELVDLRTDWIMLLTMRGLEAPCDWTLDECWGVVNIEDA